MSIDPKIDAFDDCLQRVLNGDDPRSVVQRYPEWAAEFAPMLAAARSVRQVGAVQVPRAALVRSRAKLLNAARGHRQPLVAAWSFSRLWTGFAAAALVFVLLFGGISTFAVSASALPGDTLYPLKLLSEQTRLFFTKDPSNRVSLEVSYDRLRTSEVNALISQDRSGAVQFAGGLLKFDPDLWLVNDIRVRILPGTQIDGTLREGYYIGVEGFLQADGVVMARKVWTREYEVEGVLLQAGSQQWRLDDVTFTVNPLTAIQGELVSGRRATASLAMRPDGTFEAQSILVVAEATATPTLAPSETATPHPTRTQAPPPTRQPEPTNTEKPSDSGQEQNDNQNSNEGNDNHNNNENDNEDEDGGNNNGNENGNDDHENDNDNGSKPSRTPRPTDDDDDDEHDNETPEPSRTPEHDD